MTESARKPRRQNPLRRAAAAIAYLYAFSTIEAADYIECRLCGYGVFGELQEAAGAVWLLQQAAKHAERHLTQR